MGSLILCHDQHAAHPYEITRIHCKIFTMEELCYYLCNNLYLIDYTIMNEQLCGWLEEDIGKRELADQLRDVIRMRGSVEKFSTHDFEEFRNLQGSGDDPNPECSGAAQKPEGH